MYFNGKLLITFLVGYHRFYLGKKNITSRGLNWLHLQVKFLVAPLLAPLSTMQHTHKDAGVPDQRLTSSWLEYGFILSDCCGLKSLPVLTGPVCVDHKYKLSSNAARFNGLSKTINFLRQRHVSVTVWFIIDREPTHHPERGATSSGVYV